MNSYNEEKLSKMEFEEYQKFVEEQSENDDQDYFYTKSFIKELKTARLITIIKTIIILALFVGIGFFVTESILVTLILLAAFIIVKKFVKIGSSIVYEEYNQFTGGFELADFGFLGFLIGIVAVYAALIGVQALNDILFPPYFFVMQFIIVSCLFVWLIGPVLKDICFIIESSIMIKNPPKSETFFLSEYLKAGNVGKFKKIVSRIKTIAVCAIILGALLVQTVQYFVESPKLLAKLGRSAAYTEYAEENLAIKIPEEEFENPDKREYKRFNAKCIDTYIFDSNNGGMETQNTVIVTYDYQDKWIVADYNIETEVTSVNLSGTWGGIGEDKYFIENSDQFKFTLVLDRMTESEASGHFTSVPPGDNTENKFHASFTATVEQKTEFDDNDNEQTYYVMTATADKPRGWGDDTQIIFTYHVGTDTISVSHNYNALLNRTK